MTKKMFRENDERLFAAVEEMKCGHMEAVTTVYELSKNYIYKIISDIVKNPQDTEDLMQDTYIQIMNKINSLQEERAFYVWAGRIATNLTLRYIQKHSREVLNYNPEEEMEEESMDFVPDHVLENMEQVELIARAIKQLPAEQMICVQYYYFEEMSVRDIAEAMNCAEGTVKSRLNYARRTLKAILK